MIDAAEASAASGDLAAAIAGYRDLPVEDSGAHDRLSAGRRAPRAEGGCGWRARNVSPARSTRAGQRAGRCGDRPPRPDSVNEAGRRAGARRRVVDRPAGLGSPPSAASLDDVPFGDRARGSRHHRQRQGRQLRLGSDGGRLRGARRGPASAHPALLPRDRTGRGSRRAALGCDDAAVPGPDRAPGVRPLFRYGPSVGVRPGASETGRRDVCR